MKTILLSTDFSEAARNASVYAVEFAKAIQARILLYHAYHIPYVAATDMPNFVLVEPIDPVALKQQSLSRLKKEADVLTNNSAVQIDYITTEGFAVDEILALEKKENPDFIILGVEARGAISEFLLGSVATDIIRKAKTAVIVVPETARFKKITRIALASDYTLETGTTVLKPLKELAKIFNAKLYILNIIEEEEALEVNKAIVGRNMGNYFSDVPHSFHFPEDNNFVHGLNEFIRKHDVDLVVLVPHKHKLLDRIFNEGHTKKFAFQTPVPMLSLNSND